MQRFKKAILGIFHLWQNDTFEPLLRNSKIFFAKIILLKHYEIFINKKNQKMSQGQPNP